MTQIAFAGVGVDFGATKLFSDVSFTVAPGERWGIVGRNGTGKTTLFRLLTGDLEPTRGGITRAPGLRVSLLEQHRDYGAATTVWEAAAGGLAELLALEQSLVEQAANLAHDSSPRALARYGEDLERFEREGGYALTARIDAVLHGLEVDPTQARVTPLSAPSDGWRSSGRSSNSNGPSRTKRTTSRATSRARTRSRPREDANASSGCPGSAPLSAPKARWRCGSKWPNGAAIRW